MTRSKKRQSSLLSKLKSTYYNAKKPEAYGGARQLLEKFAKKSDKKKTTINKWLRSQDAYTLHKKITRKYTHRPTIVAGMEEQLQIDLLDVSRHSTSNDNVKFLLTAIDVFSKKAWVSPIKKKDGRSVALALAAIVEMSKCNLIQSDKGTEFKNHKVSLMLKQHDVTLFHTENDAIKASIVERFNQTLKLKIHRFITSKNGNEEYLSKLGDLVGGYNNAKHTSTGMIPNNMTYENQHEAWDRINIRQQKLSEKQKVKQKNSIKPGCYVRISKATHAFDRGYTPNWSTEVFQVKSLVKFAQPTTYAIVDLANEDIQGQFYKEELQIVDKPTHFRVEDILKKNS